MTLAVHSLVGSLAMGPVPPDHRELEDLVGVAWHHAAGEGSPQAQARWKAEQGEPGHGYTYHVHPDAGRGRWLAYQCWPLEVASWHAGRRAHNPHRLGIVVTGSYDGEPWPEAAVEVVTELTALHLILLGQWDPHRVVYPEGRPELAAPAAAGHRELPWGSSKRDPTTGRVLKSCPGEAVDCVVLRDRTLRHLVARRLYTPADAAGELLAAGVVLPEVSW